MITNYRNHKIEIKKIGENDYAVWINGVEKDTIGGQSTEDAYEEAVEYIDDYMS